MKICISYAYIYSFLFGFVRSRFVSQIAGELFKNGVRKGKLTASLLFIIKEEKEKT